MPIQSFRDPRLADVLERRAPRGLKPDVLGVLRRKLVMLDAARTLSDLRVPPANHLEALVGDRKGQYSIRVNRQYRLCFVWTELGPADVEFVDYH